MGDVVPFPIDHDKRADEIQFICLSCDTAFSKRSAPNPIYVGDFVFHDVDC